MTALVSAVMTKKSKVDGRDVKGIFIPIKENHLFESKESGNIYMDIIAFPVKEPKDTMTHVLKQSLPKEVREERKDNKDEKFFGSLVVGGDRQYNDPAPEQINENDDLPF